MGVLNTFSLGWRFLTDFNCFVGIQFVGIIPTNKITINRL